MYVHLSLNIINTFIVLDFYLVVCIESTHKGSFNLDSVLCNLVHLYSINSYSVKLSFVNSFFSCDSVHCVNKRSTFCVHIFNKYHLHFVHFCTFPASRVSHCHSSCRQSHNCIITHEPMYLFSFIFQLFSAVVYST